MLLFIQHDGLPIVGTHNGSTDFFELVEVPNMGYVEADYYFGSCLFRVIVSEERPL